ncbi:hypothetical protein ACFQZQ_02820 [Lysobacter koreensis]|uniref:Uncharacterized protein n=1 Tax=Lysobacter koreensis TaxID=266122 RepID=A0ABW2YIH5_9GAMM
MANADGESVGIDGSATITSLGAGYAGCIRELRFGGACTLVHSAAIVLPNGANITTAQPDIAVFRCLTAGVWLLVSYSRTGAIIGYTPVNKAGDTMTGALNLPANGLVVGTS